MYHSLTFIEYCFLVNKDKKLIDLFQFCKRPEDQERHNQQCEGCNEPQLALLTDKKCSVVAMEEQEFEYGPGQVIKIRNRGDGQHYKTTVFPSSPLYEVVKSLRPRDKVKVNAWVESFDAPNDSIKYIRLFMIVKA